MRDDELILQSIKSLLGTAQINIDHISRREHFDQVLLRLRDKIDEYFRVKNPPDLGVKVSDDLGIKDRFGG